jgi:DNA polymerase III sliding clamp (beta) subunit (PCNA family)
VSTDETRFTLSGVYVETTDKGALRMVATDGHRLAMIDRSLSDAKLAKGVILPRKGLAELRKLLEDTDLAEVVMTVGERDARFQAGTVSLFMRLNEGEFPDYRQVVPKESRASYRRDDLLAALRLWRCDERSRRALQAGRCLLGSNRSRARRRRGSFLQGSLCPWASTRATW